MATKKYSPTPPGGPYAKCENCGRDEARVKIVNLDKDNEVYNLRWWTAVLIAAGAAIALYPYLPATWRIPVLALLAIGGIYWAYRIIQERKTLIPAKQHYCHACYHYWWEKEENGRMVKLYKLGTNKLVKKSEIKPKQ